MSGLIWLALDGIGHPIDAPTGSVWEQELPTLRPFVDSGLAVDATFGIAGLPQSGTGQSSWLTGQNAVLVMPQREHFGPHASPSLQKLLRQYALPVKLTKRGARVALVNHYPPEYFAAQAQRPRYGCFPFSALAAGLELNPPSLPSVSPLLGLPYAAPHLPATQIATQTVSELARLGHQLARAATDHDLLMADLWFGDHLGHQGAEGLSTDSEAYQAGRLYLRHLDALLAGLLAGGAKVVLTADHGNLEDLQTKMHTRARVPFASNAVPTPLPISSAGAQNLNIAQAGAQIAQYLGVGMSQP